jgi:hypothetical protein
MNLYQTTRRINPEDMFIFAAVWPWNVPMPKLPHAFQRIQFRDPVQHFETSYIFNGEELLAPLQTQICRITLYRLSVISYAHEKPTYKIRVLLLDSSTALNEASFVHTKGNDFVPVLKHTQWICGVEVKLRVALALALDGCER